MKFYKNLLFLKNYKNIYSRLSVFFRASSEQEKHFFRPGLPCMGEKNIKKMRFLILQKFHEKCRKIKKTHFYSFQCVFELPVRFKNVFLDPVWGIDVHKILPENLSRYQDKVFSKTQNALFFSFFKFYELHFT